MEPTKRTIDDPAQGLRFRLADAEWTPSVSLDAQLRAAVHARLEIQAAADPHSTRRGLLGRKRRAAG
jgi:hypothetical protein